MPQRHIKVLAIDQRHLNWQQSYAAEEASKAF